MQCVGNHDWRNLVAVHPDHLEAIGGYDTKFVEPITDAPPDAVFGLRLIVVVKNTVYRWEERNDDYVLMWYHDGEAIERSLLSKTTYSIISAFGDTGNNLYTIATDRSNGEIVQLTYGFGDDALDGTNALTAVSGSYDFVIDACMASDGLRLVVTNDLTTNFIVYDNGTIATLAPPDVEGIFCRRSDPTTLISTPDGLFDPEKGHLVPWPFENVVWSSVWVDPDYPILYYLNDELKVIALNFDSEQTAYESTLGSHMSTVTRFQLFQKQDTCTLRGTCGAYMGHDPACVCRPGYLLPDCASMGCFGFGEDTTTGSACSSHGTCSCTDCATQPGQCDCDTDYHGEMCENPVCFDTVSENTVYFVHGNLVRQLNLTGNSFTASNHPIFAGLSMEDDVAAAGSYGSLFFRVEYSNADSSHKLSVHNFTSRSCLLDPTHGHPVAMAYDHRFLRFYIVTEPSASLYWIHIYNSTLDHIDEIALALDHTNVKSLCFIGDGLFIAGDSLFRFDPVTGSTVFWDDTPTDLLHMHCDAISSQLLFLTKDGMYQKSGIDKNEDLEQVQQWSLPDPTSFAPTGHLIWPQSNLVFILTDNGKEIIVLNYNTGSLVSLIDQGASLPGVLILLQTQTGCGSGVCISVDTCQCPYGIFGAPCSEFGCYGLSPLEKDVCSGKGVCVGADTCQCDILDNGLIDGVECETVTCNPGWYGDSCDFTTCYGVLSNDSDVCNGNGVCAGEDSCTCYPGWSGLECDEYSCFGIPSFHLSACSSHGDCVGPSNCSCGDPSQYTGDECEIPICFGIPGTDGQACNAHGTCSAPNKCDCSEQWISHDCNVTSCFGVPSNSSSTCSSHGICTGPDSCECENLYNGTSCQVFSCFDMLNSDYYVCSGHGWCVDIDTCVCPTGYSMTDCSNYACDSISKDDPSVCFGSGECVALDECLCFEGYDGANCENYFCGGLPPTDGNVCNGHGECHRNRTCSCEVGFVGEYCSNLECFGLSAKDPLVCSSHGTCVNTDDCDCDDNYSTDPSCAVYSCFGIDSQNSSACGTNGVCVAHDECACDPGWSGDVCHLPVCFGLDASNEAVCSGHGECSSPGVCDCDSGYTSTQCERVFCFGHLDNETLVCSQSGQCVGPDVCACAPSYSGSECEEFPCFFKSVDDPESCSGHGVCHTINNCTCDSGYTGEQCEGIMCFGVIGTTACRQHGSCIAPDVCQCASGYTGDECSFPVCFGISNLSSTAPCNGYDCIAPDTCDCEGFDNPDCSSPLCFGVANPALMCSSRGVCSGPNTCTCNEGFEGVRCQHRTEFFLDYGNSTSDTVFELVESINTETLMLNSKKFMLFGEPQEMVRMSTNSFITFGSMPEEPPSFSLATATEPLVLFGYTFNDLSVDLALYNKMYYRQSSVQPSLAEKDDLQLITEFVQAEFEFHPTLHTFNASWYFVVTADHVGYYPQGTDKLNSVQMILTVDETRNFSMVIYNFRQEGIMHPETNPIIGFTSGASGHHLDLMQTVDPVTRRSENIVTKTNVQSNGFYSYPTHEPVISHFDIIPLCGGIPANDPAVCSGRGNCTAKDLCVCEPYSKGANCETYCKDSGDWSGVFCQKPRCFGLAWDHNSVCSGHGSCVAPNQCECNTPYHGTDCSKFNCYGIAASNSTVCSGHGTCTRLDVCECISGWAHNISTPNVKQCDQFTCNDKRPDQANACANDGVCVGPNQCVGCKEPFFGDTCDEGFRYVDPVFGDDSNPNTCLYRESPCKTLAKVFQHITFRNRIVLMGGVSVLPITSTYIKQSVYFIGENGAVITTSNMQSSSAFSLIVNLRSNVELHFSNIEFRNIRSAALLRIYFGSNSVIRLENVRFVNARRFFDYEGDGTVTVNATNVHFTQSKDSFALIRSSQQRQNQYIHVTNFFAYDNTLTGALFDIQHISSFTMHHSRVIQSSAKGTCVLRGEWVKKVSITDSQFEHITAGDAPLLHLANSDSIVVQDSEANTVSSSGNGLMHITSTPHVLLTRIMINGSVSSEDGSVAHFEGVDAIVVNESQLYNTKSLKNGGFWMHKVGTLLMEHVIAEQITAEAGALLYTSEVPQILVQHCTVREARGVESSEYLSGEGAAIFAYGTGSVRVLRSTFDSCDSTLFTKGSFMVRVEECSVSHNSHGAIQINDNTALFVTINSTTFTANSNDEGFGGSISLVGVSALITINDCTFFEESAVNGGALFLIEVDRFLVIDSTFTSCSAVESGGAISVEVANVVEMYRSKFNANKASSGGAVLLKKVVRSLFFIRYGGSILEECVFTRNSANEGGSLYLSTENVAQIRNTQFSQNHAMRSGGAILAEGYTYASTFETSPSTFANSSFDELLKLDPLAGLLVSGSSFISNTAGGNGGAFSFFSSGVRFLIESSTFAANRAEENGGTFFVLVNSGSILDCFITSASASRGSALYVLMVTSTTYGLQLHSVHMDKCSASSRGTIYLQPTITFSMSHCTMTECAASSGNIFIDRSTVTVMDSTFERNSVESNGAVFSLIGDASLLCGNSTFTANTAAQGGVAFVDTYGTISFDNITSIANTAAFGGTIYFEKRADNSSNTAGGSFKFNVTNSKLRDSASVAGGSFFISMNEFTIPPQFSQLESVALESTTTGYGPHYASNPDDLNIVYLRQSVTSTDYQEWNIADNAQDSVVMKIFPGQQFSVHFKVYDMYKQTIPEYPGLSVRATSSLNMIGVLQQVLSDSRVPLNNIRLRGKRFTNNTITFSSDGLEVPTKTRSVRVELYDCPQGYRVDIADSFDNCVSCPRGSYSIAPSSTVCHDNCVGFSCAGGYSIQYKTGFWIEVKKDGRLRAIPCLSGHCVGGTFEYLHDGGLRIPFLNVDGTVNPGYLDTASSRMLLLEGNNSSTNNTSALSTTLGSRYIGAECTGNREGVLCGQCTEGYELMKGNCVPCNGVNQFLILVHILHLLALLGYIHFTSQSEKTGGAVKIFVIFMQTCMLSVDVKKWAANNDSDALVVVIDLVKSAFALEMPSFGGGEDENKQRDNLFQGCPFPRPGYWIYGYDLMHFFAYLVVIALCAVLGSLLCCACTRFSRRKARQRLAAGTINEVLEGGGGLIDFTDISMDHVASGEEAKTSLRERLITRFNTFFTPEAFVRTFINTIIFKVLPLTNLTMTYLLGCIPLETGEYVMVGNTSLECWTTATYWLWSLLFVPVLALIIFGPSITVVLLALNRKRLNNPGFRKYFGPLYEIYKPKYFWFEWVFMTQRTLLIVGSIVSQMLTISYGVSGVQYVFYAVIVATTFLLVLNFSPYKSEGDNSFQKFSLFITLLILGVQEGTSSYTESVGVIVGILLMCSCAAALIFWIIMANAAVQKFAYKIRDKVTGKSNVNVIAPMEFNSGPGVEGEIPRETRKDSQKKVMQQLTPEFHWMMPSSQRSLGRTNGSQFQFDSLFFPQQSESDASSSNYTTADDASEGSWMQNLDEEAGFLHSSMSASSTTDLLQDTRSERGASTMLDETPRSIFVNVSKIKKKTE